MPPDLKQNLQETDYGNFLQNEVCSCARARARTRMRVCMCARACACGVAQRTQFSCAAQPSPIAPSTVHERCVGKLAKEFDYLRSCAVGDLATFLDFIKCVPRWR